MGTGDNRGNWSVGKQRGVVEEGGSVNLSVDNSGSIDHRLDNWGVGNSANWGGKGAGEGSGEWGGEGGSDGGGEGGGNRGLGKASDGVKGRVEDGGGNSGGSSHNRGGGSGDKGGGGGLDNHGSCGGDGINKSILVQVLRESLEGE